MKKPSNKAIAVYLSWILLHIVYIMYLRNPLQFEIEDIVFLLIAPILIYYIVTLFKSNDITDK